MTRDDWLNKYEEYSAEFQDSIDVEDSRYIQWMEMSDEFFIFVRDWGRRGRNSRKEVGKGKDSGSNIKGTVRKETTKGTKG